jgi:hypothetical protein
MHDDRLIVNGDVTPGNLGHGAYVCWCALDASRLLARGKIDPTAVSVDKRWNLEAGISVVKLTS